VRAGAAYVLFGRASSSSSVDVDVSLLSTSQGYAIHGVSFGDALGVSVSGAGDIYLHCICFAYPIKSFDVQAMSTEMDSVT
jgi:hypothetical protein